MIQDVLEQRGNRYGEFINNAKFTHFVKEEMRNSPSWKKMYADQREALDMIAHKMARIVNGDPDYEDSWTDIAGYATLVAERLKNSAHQKHD
jgi:hypothetical protein